MGKARAFSTEGEDANYLRESEDETYKVTQQNSYNLGSTTFSDQSGIGNFSQSGTDQRKANLTGALFRGNIGFLLQSSVLDETTSTMNIIEDQSGNPVSEISSDVIVIISGVATTADLEIILGAQRPGQRLVLYNTDGNTITIKDASTAASPTDPNLIHTPGALDYIITGFDSVQLVFDSIEEQWRIVGAVGTGGGTGYNLIQDEGISLTQRTTMNFIGNSVTAVDNPGQSRTDITINTPSGTIPDGTAENQHLEWDNSFLTWNAVDALTLGTTGPFAASGFLRTANDEIIFASRNAGDSDDIRLKINSSDRFIFEFPGSLVPLEVAVDLIDVKSVDIVNIDRLKFVQSSGSMVPSDTTGILKNSNAQFQFNSQNSNAFLFTFNTDTALTLTPTSLTLENTSSTPFFTFFRDEPGTDDQIISNIIFKGQTASGGDFIYGAIETVITDDTLGQEKSEIILSTTQEGIFANNKLTINADADRTLRYDSNFDASTLTPQFEIRTFYTISPPTGAVDIGQLNFSTNTNDSSTIGAQEIFASIIGTQEDPDIDNESGSLRFRLRDQTGFAGSLKTYLQFNDSSNGIIEALKDVTLENFTLNPVLTLFRNETGVTDNPLGNIVFRGRQSNDNPFTYSTISSTISDATLGQEDSIITLSATNDGLLANVQLVVNADSSQILRFDSTSPSASFASPVLELLAAVGIAPPTGAVQRIGEITFEATTNDAGGVGAVEPFAQIIVDQEESDITNEAAGMRFRLRDQTGTAGALKTYLSFNQGNNDLIQASKTLDMGGNEITSVQNIFTNDDTGNNILGALDTDIDNPGGWELFIHRRITSDEDASMYIEFDTGGLEIISDAQLNLIASNAMVLAADSATWILDGSTGMTWFVDGSTKMTIQPDAFTTRTGVDHILLGSSNIEMNVGYFEIDSFGGDPTTPAGTKGRIFNKIDPDSGNQEPFWIDPNGLITSMLGGGGGTGAGVVGTSIVKGDEEGITNDTTLTIDNEFQFIPEANTIYFIQWNLKFISPFTQIKVAVEGGVGMTYQIVRYNDNSIPEDWSPVGASNDEILTFSNTVGSNPEDAHSVQLYAIVDSGNNTDAIGLSWAQNSSSGGETIINNGSLMRIFGEGVNGGGSGEVNDYTVTNTQASDPDDGYLDINKDFIGNNNGFEDLNISLGTSNPGTPTTTITISSSDMPKFSPIENVLEYVSFGVIMSGVCKNSGSSTRAIVQGYVNGSPNSDAAFTAFNPTANGNNAEVAAYMSDESVGPGDVIGLAVWTDGGTGMDLEDVALWVFPTEIKLLGRNFQLVFPGTSPNPDFETFTITGNNPAGISNIASGGFFSRYLINGSAPSNVTNEWFFDDIQLVQGGELRPEAAGFSSNFAQNSNANDRLFSASMEGFRFLRFVR